VPERHAAIGRPAPGKTGTFEGSSHQTRSPTRSAPSRCAPRTPRTSPAATRKGQGRRHESAAKQSVARRSAGAKTLAASPNLSTMNRETKRSCGGHYRRENLATDHWCYGVEVRTYTRGRRGVQRLIDGRLPDVDERSISSASGPRSLHKRMPAVRRSWPPGQVGAVRPSRAPALWARAGGRPTLAVRPYSKICGHAARDGAERRRGSPRDRVWRWRRPRSSFAPAVAWSA
jgi:hypothetical protein